MADTQFQLRRDTSVDLSAVVPVMGEPGFDITKKRFFVGDDVRPGGVPHANYRDVQNQSFSYVSVTGTNTITATLDEKPETYVEGMRFTLKPENTNTGVTTINFNALGDRDIKKYDGTSFIALEGGELQIGVPVDVIYDGTRFVVQLGGGAGGAAYVLLAEVDASNHSTIDFDSSIVDGSYNRYVVDYTDLIPSVDGAILLCRFSTGGIFSAASSYHCFGQYQVHTSAVTPYSGGSSSIALTAGIGIGKATNETGACGDLTLYNPNRNGYHKCVFNSIFANQTPQFYRVMGNCMTNAAPFLTNNIDGIRFLMNSGNIESGNIKIYGVQ